MTDLRHSPDAPPAPQVVTELGYAPMDTIHAELEALLERASTCAGHGWLPLLSEIDAHLRDHFAVEDQWMRETDFPPRDCHMDEHAAVLRSAAQVLELARRGDYAPAPSFVAALAEWFPGHATYLDSALAAWMCKRQFGGRPVVLHRRRAGTAAS